MKNAEDTPFEAEGAGDEGGVVCGVEESGDVLTSAPMLDAVLGRGIARRLVAFGSLSVLAGETLEACVDRHLAAAGDHPG
jgi:hypothetical protein